MDPLPLIRDQAWQFILGVLAIMVTVVLYIRARSRKELSYRVLSAERLISPRAQQHAGEGRLEILYAGLPTSDVGLIVVRIENSGNVAIVQEDFDQDLDIVTHEGTAILNVEITRTNPQRLIEHVELGSVSNHNRIRIKRLLLNPKDSITIRLLVQNFRPDIEVDGRIAGISRIRAVGPGPETTLDKQISQIIGGAVFMGGATTVLGMLPILHGAELVILFVVVLLTLTIVLIFVRFLVLRDRNGIEGETH